VAPKITKAQEAGLVWAGLIWVGVAAVTNVRLSV